MVFRKVRNFWLPYFCVPNLRWCYEISFVLRLLLHSLETVFKYLLFPIQILYLNWLSTNRPVHKQYWWHASTVSCRTQCNESISQVPLSFSKRKKIDILAQVHLSGQLLNHPHSLLPTLSIILGKFSDDMNPPRPSFIVLLENKREDTLRRNI